MPMTATRLPKNTVVSAKVAAKILGIPDFELMGGIKAGKYAAHRQIMIGPLRVSRREGWVLTIETLEREIGPISPQDLADAEQKVLADAITAQQRDRARHKAKRREKTNMTISNAMAALASRSLHEDQPLMVTFLGAAILLKVSETYVRQLVKRGEIKSTRDRCDNGRLRIWIPVTEIERKAGRRFSTAELDWARNISVGRSIDHQPLWKRTWRRIFGRRPSQ